VKKEKLSSFKAFLSSVYERTCVCVCVSYPTFYLPRLPFPEGIAQETNICLKLFKALADLITEKLCVLLRMTLAPNLL